MAALKGYHPCLAAMLLVLFATCAISRPFAPDFNQLIESERSRISQLRVSLGKKQPFNCDEFLKKTCDTLGPEKCFGLATERDRREFGNQLLEIYKALKAKGSAVVNALEKCGFPEALDPEVETEPQPVMTNQQSPSSTANASSGSNEVVLSELEALKNEVFKIEDSVNRLGTKLCGQGWPHADCNLPSRIVEADA